jgi:hypothetical protein
LRQAGSDHTKTTTILQANYYGWFKRVRRGVYTLTKKGEQDLEKFPQLTSLFQGKIQGLDETKK